MTALATPPDSGTPVPEPVALDLPPQQLSHVVADLMPDEIVGSRRLAHLQRRIVFGLCALVLLLVLGYALAWVQTRNAQTALAGEQSNTVSLNQRVDGFGHLVRIQGQTQTLQTQLAGVMTNDLPWGSLLRTLAAKAPAGVRVTDVNASVTGPGSDQTEASSGSSGQQGITLDPTGDPVVGTMTVSGTASRYDSVADFLDTLARVPGLIAANPATTSAGPGGLTYVIDLSITTKALHGRFAAPATSGSTTGGN